MRTLYLSHNALRSLAGLAQFPALQQLALSHNHVAELAQLRHLRPVSSRLHTLSLDGNPVATVPLYREHCLSACPALTLLDGQPVDCAERAAATEALRAEGDLLRAMRADAMTLEQVLCSFTALTPTLRCVPFDWPTKPSARLRSPPSR